MLAVLLFTVNFLVSFELFLLRVRQNWSANFSKSSDVLPDLGFLTRVLRGPEILSLIEQFDPLLVTVTAVVGITAGGVELCVFCADLLLW